MKKIILIRISGGLGNQLFIYNYYLLLLKRHPQHTIYFDKTPYEKLFSNGRNDFCVKYNVNYILNHFFDLNYLNKYLCKLFYNIAKLNSKYFKFKAFPRLLNEKELSGNHHLIDKCYFSVVNGHFISRSLIQDLKEIRFEKILLLNDAQSILLNEIRASNSVSIHLRGGQYIKETNIMSEYAVITRTYYEKAIDYIKRNVENPIFYIFTNDQDYAKSFFNSNSDQLILVPSNPEYIDFNLMSNCKNNIIINSTFSWWAAYLNTNVNRVVIAPLTWSGKKMINPDYDSLPLNSWIKIENE